MRIEISLSDGVPIYRQIANQVKYLIASGQLQSDEELPPIRSLALQLSVTPNTIVKAYDLLQSEQLVYKRQGAGTFVSDTKSPLARAEQKRILTQRVDALLSEASHLNFSLDEIVALIHKRQDVLAKSNSRHSTGNPL